MAHWKYHMNPGDLVQFWYDWDDDDGAQQLYSGTIMGFREPADWDEDDAESYDDIDLSEWEAVIKSNRKEVSVPIDDIEDRVPKDERDTDLPSMSEEFRFSGGLGQK